jgi:hypothetical protein
MGWYGGEGRKRERKLVRGDVRRLLGWLLWWFRLLKVVEVMNVVEEELVRVVWVVVGSLLGWWKVVRREGKLRENRL